MTEDRAARHRALSIYAVDLERRALLAPAGDERDDLCVEALAARARMLELEAAHVRPGS